MNNIPLINHKIGSEIIAQRASDGYINATAMCKANGKRLTDYLVNKVTKAFLAELSRSVRILTDLLVVKIMDGPNNQRGTWVHPQVAINLGQWCSPEFAVLVTKWVFEWMNGDRSAKSYQMPYSLRRLLINRHKIPMTHFSMLDQMAVRLLFALETNGYVLPNHLMPDIALGRMFSSWLREQGHDPRSFPTYRHVFDNGKRPPVQARLYPNELMSSFNIQLGKWITSGKALNYFKDRDTNAIEPLKLVITEIKQLEEN